MHSITAEHLSWWSFRDWIQMRLLGLNWDEWMLVYTVKTEHGVLIDYTIHDENTFRQAVATLYNKHNINRDRKVMERLKMEIKERVSQGN
jgi:hypothetical protein